MTVRWGFVGARTIAREHVLHAVRARDEGEAVAVMNSDAERGRPFAAAHGIARSTTSLHEPVSAPDIDAVCVSTNNELHREQTLAAAGEDGVWSPATALAFVESARSGKAVAVELGLAAP